MDSALPLIDTFEKFKDWQDRINYDGGFYVPATFLPTVSISTCSLDTETAKLAEVPEPDVFGFRSGSLTRENFWVTREFMRMNEGLYQPAFFLAHLRRLWNSSSNSAYHRYWWHAVHVAVSDPSKIAFTPNHAYGLRDRQVVMKVGKYLKKFYGDLLNDDQIRDLANLGVGREVHWAHTPEEIMNVYCNGPQSCMKGNEAITAYSYQYPQQEGGRYEFGVAYLRGIDGAITARALVSMMHRVFPRYYGDEGPILSSILEMRGFKKVSSMALFPTRLVHQPSGERENSPIRMPYLDGDCKQIWGKLRDSAGKLYWAWSERNPGGADDDRWAEQADGYVYHGSRSDEDDEDDEDYRYCAYCDNRFHEDDLHYSDYHDESFCSGCLDTHYRYAYYSARHDDKTYVHEDNCVYCETDSEYYLDTSAVLEYHDVAQASNGDYYKKSELVLNIEREWVLEDSFNDPISAGYDADGDTLYCERSDITLEWEGSMDGRFIEWNHPEAYGPDNYDERKTLAEWLEDGNIRVLNSIEALVEDSDQITEWKKELGIKDPEDEDDESAEPLAEVASVEPVTQPHFTEVA